jgi:hypothetical protein
MANNNRLTRGEASVGSLIVDDLIRFSDATEQTTAYIPTTVDPHYISAYSTATQTNTGGGTAPVAMRFETISDANQITIVNNTRITPNHSSEYNIQFSAQVDKTDGGEDNIDIWFAINGTAVPFSNTRLTLPKNDSKAVASWNFITPLQDTEYLEIYWYSADTAMRLYAEGPQTNPTRPAIPSVILTAWEI